MASLKMFGEVRARLRSSAIGCHASQGDAVRPAPSDVAGGIAVSAVMHAVATDKSVVLELQASSPPLPPPAGHSALPRPLSCPFARAMVSLAASIGL